MALDWIENDNDVLDRKATEELRIKQRRVLLWERFGILRDEEPE